MARPFFVILVSLLLANGVAIPSVAQPAELTVTVVRQPVWHRPGDPLGLAVRLSNNGSSSIEGYRVTVAAHGRVLSRSELHESFDTPATFEASLITAIEAVDQEIGPGDSIVREIEQPVGTLQSLADATEAGVYPLKISVVDAAGAVLASSTTQLIYYPTPPEFRLPTVPVVPIAAVPSRGPDGGFRPDEDGSYPLEDAVQPGGWLTGFLENLDRATTAPPPEPERRGRGRGRGRNRGRPTEPEAAPLNAGVVVMPRLAEELADMADGYRRGEEESGPSSPGAVGASRALESLRRITAQGSVQPILAPYALPDLPTLFDAFPRDSSDIAAGHLEQQLNAGEAVLGNTVLEAPSRSWVYTPAGRVGYVALEELQQADAATFTFFAEEALEPLTDPAGGGCPEPPLSFTCPVEVSTSLATSSGYVFDREVQSRVAEVAAGDGGRNALQRLFAEIAMIREEVPSRTDRVLAVGLPDLWEPSPRVTRLLFEGFRDAPGLETLTPRDGLTRVTQEIDPLERRIRFDIPRLVNEPDADHLEKITAADEVIEGFRGLQPPPPLLERLTRNALVSESIVWSKDPTFLQKGESYAEDAAAEVRRELGKVTIGGEGEIALTSRQAQIPVVVFNDAAYDVSVTVRISSAELRLDETFTITVQARGLQQLGVGVAAQSSGIFTVDVVVEAPNGLEIERRAVRVRSTEFNEIALGLTFGALAFLVLFYITRATRGRRAARKADD